MRLPNWFKITWWIILITLTGLIMLKRINAIIEGTANAVDLIILLIFITLMLVPLFSEIKIFGIQFKREIEDLKSDIGNKLIDLRHEIRISQNQTFNATIQGFGPPPPDNKLPELETEIEKIVKVKLSEHGFPDGTKIKGRIEVPEENLNLFKVRYSIERQLRRIWEARFIEETNDIKFKYQSIMKVIQDLTKYDILNNDFYGILKEILAICNYAIHGEKVTDNQIQFVTNNARKVLDYLYRIG